MPIYEYRCETCDITFEIEQSFSDDSLKKCPKKSSGFSPAGCRVSGRGKVVKLFSAPGITFKGSGFYKNDSRESSRAGSKTTGGDSSTAESSDGDAAPAESGASGSTGDDANRTSATSSDTTGSESGSKSSTGDGAQAKSGSASSKSTESKGTTPKKTAKKNPG